MLNHISKSVEFLKQWCFDNKIVWPETASTQFEQYISLILRYQKQTNLTGYSDPESLVRELMIDSIKLLKIYTPQGPVVDVGSGAGFPGIPLKILLPKVSFHLVEPRTKRYAFLQLVCRELGLCSVEVHREKIEALHFDQVGTAISKAFAQPASWLQLCQPWARNGAHVVGYFSLKDFEALNLDPSWEMAYKIVEDQRVYVVFRATRE